MHFHDKWTCCLSLRTIAHVTKLWVSWGSYTNDFSPENTWMKTTSLILNRDFSKTVISLKHDLGALFMNRVSRTQTWMSADTWSFLTKSAIWNKTIPIANRRLVIKLAWTTLKLIEIVLHDTFWAHNEGLMSVIINKGFQIPTLS